LVPIAISGLVGYAVMSALSSHIRVNLAILTIINASLLVMIGKAVSRFFLAPSCSNLRLLPVPDGPARFLHRWMFRLAVIASFGWFGISALRILGLPKVAAAAALKVDGIVILIILVTLIIRKRRPVARWIRGAESKDPARMTAFMSVRRSLAGIWHVLAVVYLAVIFGVWIFDVEGGIEFALRASVLSLAVLGGARLLVVALEELIQRGTKFSHTEGSFPRLRRRVDAYLPIAHSSLSVIVWLAAVLTVVEIWGLGTFDWFDTPAGEVVLARLASIAFVVGSAVVAWEMVSAIIEVYLVGAIHNGTPVERSQRVRTLLPLLRNAFTIFLIVVVVLTVLSELGINIAPLLAGAGVVGIAIGFGAQTLVKDIITGMFILFENTIAVGDVVDVGGGHSGLVEHFSLRTLKVRDGTGGLHTVPFSSVTTVNNMSKDFSSYVFNIKVDYGQDTDRIVQLMKDLGKEMQDDPAYAKLILAPLEVFGVDSFGAETLVIQASFKTKPLQQWSVAREFNRRLKKKFDELGISMRAPERFVMMPNGLPAPTADVEAPPKAAKKS
jgi:small conductance mechanosensitive channel